jgi:hypothetical protein
VSDTVPPAAACSRFADLVVSSDRPLPELPAAPPSSVPDVVVTHAAAPLRDPIRWFQTWRAGDDTVRFGRVDDGYVVAFDELADIVVSRDADRVVIHPDPAGSDFQVRYVLLHQILPLIMSRRGRCVLHASAVSWRDRIVGFVGRTGSGKSTIAAACASLGAGLVTDDSLVLDDSTGTWRGLPSYPGLRLLPESLALVGASPSGPLNESREHHKFVLMAARDLSAFEHRSLPVARLFLLSPAADAGPAVRAPRGAAAAVVLASQLFRLDVENAAESRRLFEMITSLATTVPVSVLHVGGDGDDLRRVARGVLDGIMSGGGLDHGV